MVVETVRFLRLKSIPGECYSRRWGIIGGKFCGPKKKIELSALCHGIETESNAHGAWLPSEIED
jgi:hypothetical protein